MDPRLLVIATPAIRTEADELVGRALVALSDIHKLDDTLYERFVASRSTRQEPGALAASLRRVWNDTFSSLQVLLALCRKLSESRQPATSSDAEPGDDFDFGDLEAGPSPQPEASLELQASDIGDLVANLGDPSAGANEGERWGQALEKVGSIQYGLQSMYGDATGRMDAALQAGQVGTVLSLLDDTTSSANEGIHALVAAIYAAFAPNADPESLVPQYLTTLKRALKVRAGIAALAAHLNPLNDVLQGTDVDRHAEAFAAVREAVHGFVSSDVWRAMRAADRWELVQFDQQLHEATPRGARLICEGLVKYLESLGSINQREVLVQHDQRILDELRETTINARELMNLSPKTTHQLLVKACQSSLALRGRRQGLDPLLEQLSHLGVEVSAPSENEALLQWVEAILAAAG